MRRAVVAVLCLLALTGVTLQAATFETVTDARLVGRAELVVVATVEGSASRQVDRVIVTDYSLRVEQVLRGHAPAGVLTVTELGGHANGLLMIVSGSASYTPGSRVMAFLRPRGDGTYFTAFMSNGSMRFARGAGGREIIIRTNDEAMTAAPAKEFIEYIRGDRAVAPMAVPYQEDDAPSISASASQYTISGGSPSRPVRWPGCNVNCTIQFVLNGVQPVPDSAGGVGDALGAWTGDPNSFVKLQLNGLTAITQAAQDNVNTILLDNANPAPLAVCDGAIACGVAYATSNTHNFDGDTFYGAFEADVIYRPGAASQNTFAAILTHELGHGLAFRHANSGTPSSTSAIMSSPTPTSQGATLRDWDKEALAEVYGAGVVCVPPDISSIAGGGTINYGSRTTLSATITGSSPRTHQWYEGTAPDTSTPVGTNQSTFQTPNITAEHKYWLKVTNECGDDVSATITVKPTECDDANITTEPLSQRIQPNQTATLDVVATGTAPLKYDWYEGERGTTTKKVGTNSPQFKTPALTANTTYWVRVSNLCGSDDSQAAVITVGTQCVQPAISQQPASAELSVGSKALLHVSATGDTPIAFQWYEGEAPDGTKPIAGATSAVYEPGPFTTAGAFKYWAKATNACGSANSNTATITVVCNPAVTPTINVPPISPRSLGYDISWIASLVTTNKFELQEATNPDFTSAKTFVINGALKFGIEAHTEVTTDTRFYYRVRGFSACNGTPTGYSNVSNTLVTVPPPSNSTEFVVGIPDGTSQPFKQDYLVPGFGASATNNDTFSLSSTVPWITIFPASGALSAGGTTVQLTINPAGLSSGSVTGTINVVRINATAARGGAVTHGTTTAVLPFSLSLVTPVSPAPRDTTPPAGTLLIPAIAHADGIGTRFQSDIRIANAANEAITYDISFTPSASNGTAVGKKTTMVVGSNETKGLDDVVKLWFGAGVVGEAGLGTLEIRPLKLASGGIPNPLATFASSRTYAISSTGTLGQFIPALPLSGFIGEFAKDNLARISLQQVAHNDRYRTNFGIAEGSGQPANLLVKLLDANNQVIKSVPLSLTAYEHQQLRFDAVFGSGVTIADGRIEVEVTSATGKVTAYASVLDNNTADPLLVFPVQAGKLSATRYVVPGVAELSSGSNFHTDMRLYNPSTSPITLTLAYKPQRGDTTAIPSVVTRTVNAGQVLAIDNVLPTLWNLNASGGAVTVTTPNAAPLVVTARTFSREEDGGTYGQFIPAVTSTDAVGLGERALEVLQLEDSDSFRSNVGLVEVTGNPVTVEMTLRTPDAKDTAFVHFDLAGGEFMQIQRIFKSTGYGNVYNGRVSMRVVGGQGRVAGYGSVVDNRTEDPTYVPSQ